MGDYNLSPRDATLLKHLLANIGNAVCRRLDAIDERLETICITTQCIHEQLDLLCKNNVSELESYSPETDCSDTVMQDDEDVALPDVVSPLSCHKKADNVNLNREDNYPNGSWLGDINDCRHRIRVPISPSDLAHIRTTCRSPSQLALTLLDRLFNRETQASSSVSGSGKHQLDPLFVYGIRCELVKRFGISPAEWRQIRMRIDSKCRTAHRRKCLGLPLTVKGYHNQESASDSRSETGSVQDASEDKVPDSPTDAVCAASVGKNLERAKGIVVASLSPRTGELWPLEGERHGTTTIHIVYACVWEQRSELSECIFLKLDHYGPNKIHSEPYMAAFAAGMKCRVISFEDLSSLQVSFKDFITCPCNVVLPVRVYNTYREVQNLPTSGSSLDSATAVGQSVTSKAKTLKRQSGDVFLPVRTRTRSLNSDVNEVEQF